MINPFSLVSCRKMVIFFLTLFILVTIHGSVSAEVIQFISGKSVEGKIVLRDDELIKIDTGIGIPITYYLDEIESIDGEAVVLVSEEPAQVPAPVKTVDPIEITGPVEVVETVETIDFVEVLEPDKIAESVKEVEPENVAVPDAQTTKPVSAKSSLDGGKYVEHYLIGRIMGEENNTNDAKIKTGTKKKSKNAIFQAINQFIGKKLKSITERKIQFQKKLPHILEKLNQIPVKVRRDIFVIASSLLAVIYILVCFPLMNIAKKLNKRHAWLIWVPIVHIFYILHMAGKSLLWFIYFMIPLINFFVFLVVFAHILKALKKSSWLLIPIIIPGLNIFTLWYLALTKEKQSVD